MGACVSKKTEQLLTCGRNGSKITQSNITNHICSLGGYEKQRSMGVRIMWNLTLICMCRCIFFPSFFFYIFIVWTLMFLQVSPIIHMQNKKGGRERTCSLTFGKELHL